MKKQKTDFKQKEVTADGVQARLVMDLKNQLARALADYDNLRKRVDRERQDFVRLANLNLIVSLLPIIDQLDEAQKHLGDSGLAITIGQFREIIKENGLEEIKVKEGDNFDENLSEVVEIVEDSSKSGKIAGVVLSGWKFIDGPVIRHAKVKVYK